MTRRTNARVAGATFLLYIVVGITDLIVFGGTDSGSTPAARLESIASNASVVPAQIGVALTICVIATTLGASLYGLTREEDHELALLAFVFRAMEGMVAAIAPLFTLALLFLATNGGAPTSADAAATNAIAGVLFKVSAWKATVAAILFSFGSTIFTWLMLRGGMIPRPLAVLGFAASILLVAVIPLQLMGILTGGMVNLVWVPMALFEIPLGFWLIIKGAERPTGALRSAMS
jgi:hypothetical protein